MPRKPKSTYIPPHPRTREQLDHKVSTHIQAHTPSRALVSCADAELAARIAGDARTLGIQVPTQTSYCAPNIPWILGLAVQLGLPLVAQHLRDTGCLPIRQ